VGRFIVDFQGVLRHRVELGPEVSQLGFRELGWRGVPGVWVMPGASVLGAASVGMLVWRVLPLLVTVLKRLLER
jgi:hypothetical protein